jgi:uncharacterized protein YegL
MTNPDYAHYVLIIDRSGSMSKIQADAQGGIRQFINDQAALPGKATLSLCQFDNEHEMVYDFATLAEAAAYVLVPRGMTRLLDACGFAVTQAGERLAALAEKDRPGRVVVLIATDGEENDSREYSLQQVRKLFTVQQETYGWQFTYIGANVDAFTDARMLGIPSAATMDYAATGEGTRAAYAAASASVREYASGRAAAIAYTDDDRARAAGKKAADGDENN